VTTSGRAVFPLALLAVLVAAGCRRAAVGESAPLQTLEDLTLRQTLRGAPVWELQARSAVLHEDDAQALLAEPRMQFYRDGRVASRVSSVTGRVRVDTHDVFLSSSVVLEVPEERSVLSTDSLDYSSRRNLFTTDAEVVVRRPEGRLKGRGLEAKPDLSEIRIFHQRSLVERGGS